MSQALTTTMRRIGRPLALTALAFATAGGSRQQSTQVVRIKYAVPSGQLAHGYVDASANVKWRAIACIGEVWLVYSFDRSSLSVGSKYLFNGKEYDVSAEPPPSPEVIQFTGGLVYLGKPVGTFSDVYTMQNSGSGCISGQTKSVGRLESQLPRGYSPAQRQEFLDRITIWVSEAPTLTNWPLEERILAAERDAERAKLEKAAAVRQAAAERIAGARRDSMAKVIAARRAAMEQRVAAARAQGDSGRAASEARAFRIEEAKLNWEAEREAGRAQRAEAERATKDRADLDARYASLMSDGRTAEQRERLAANTDSRAKSAEIAGRDPKTFARLDSLEGEASRRGVAWVACIAEASDNNGTPNYMVTGGPYAAPDIRSGQPGDWNAYDYDRRWEADVDVALKQQNPRSEVIKYGTICLGGSCIMPTCRQFATSARAASQISTWEADHNMRKRAMRFRPSFALNR